MGGTCPIQTEKDGVHEEVLLVVRLGYDMPESLCLQCKLPNNQLSALGAVG